MVETMSDREALDKILGDKPVTGGTISDKLVMPRPGDKGVIVVFLYNKELDGTLKVIKIVKNDKFTTGEGGFFNVGLLDNPGIEYQVGVGKSMGNAIQRMLNTNKWQIEDLPGKIAHITANYYDKIPCSKCNGRGCSACEHTGKSTVFNVRARLDLMSVTSNVKKTDEF